MTASTGHWSRENEIINSSCYKPTWAYLLNWGSQSNIHFDTFLWENAWKATDIVTVVAYVVLILKCPQMKTLSC